MSLRRELGLRDVTLFATICIVGPRWIAAAAHGGPGSITLWVVAAVFFAAPLAVAAGALAVKYPGAGGLYVWTRADFGPWHGFLCFWIYWMAIAIWFPGAAMFYMGSAAWTLGFAENRAGVVVASLIAIWIALATNLIGMRIGKWTENAGAAATWVLGVVLIAAAAIVWTRRGAATPMHFTPEWSWKAVSFWSTIAYAMTGLEVAGMMGGEIRDPERTLPLAGWLASAFATIFYASTTLALLVLLRPESITEMGGLAQAGATAGLALRVSWLAPLIAGLLLLTGVGQFGGLGTGVSRLPFAAGVDRLLPAAFARIHPRWGTPHLAILSLGAVASGLLIAIQLGDTLRAAYQAIVSLTVIAGFLPFVYLFGSAWKAGKRVSAISGWAVTALALGCSVAPTAEITNVWLFEGKLAAGTLAVIGSAWLVYRRSENVSHADT